MRLYIILLYQAITGQANSQTSWQVSQYVNDSSTLFVNGWKSTLGKNYVMAEKDSVRMYLFYPVSTITDIKPDVFSIRRYFWTHYLKDMFINPAINDFIAQPAYDFLFRQGIVTDNKTGRSCYLLTDTILENTRKPNTTAAFIAWVYPYTGKSDFWEVHNKTVKSYYRFCNRFSANPDSIAGYWKEIIYTENYNPAPRYRHGNKSTYFKFESDSSYENSQMGYVGRNKTGLWQSFSFTGTFKFSNGYLLFSNRRKAKTEKFEYWFEVIGENKKLLHLKNDKGEQYRLSKFVVESF